MNHIYPIKYIKWTIEIPWNPPGYGSFLIFLPAASFPVTSGCEVQIFCAGAQLCGQQGQAGDVFLAKNHQIPWQEKSQPCQALELWWIAICYCFGLIHIIIHVLYIIICNPCRYVLQTEPFSWPSITKLKLPKPQPFNSCPYSEDVRSFCFTGHYGKAGWVPDASGDLHVPTATPKMVHSSRQNPWVICWWLKGVGLVFNILEPVDVVSRKFSSVKWMNAHGTCARLLG